VDWDEHHSGAVVGPVCREASEPPASPQGVSPGQDGLTLWMGWMHGEEETIRRSLSAPVAFLEDISEADGW